MIDTGDQAPDFTLPALDGLRYSLHEVVGDGPVVLAIWQAGCGACRLAAPYFNRLNDAYENISWSFLTVAQDVEAKARAFVEQQRFRPTVLVDGPALDVSKIYDPPSTPTLYVIEPPGQVTMISAGFSKDDLNQISHRIADYLGAEYLEVAPDDDGNPRFRPG